MTTDGSQTSPTTTHHPVSSVVSKNEAIAIQLRRELYDVLESADLSRWDKFQRVRALYAALYVFVTDAGLPVELFCPMQIEL
jgi:hypothetical protein